MMMKAAKLGCAGAGAGKQQGWSRSSARNSKSRAKVGTRQEQGRSRVGAEQEQEQGRRRSPIIAPI